MIVAPGNTYRGMRVSAYRRVAPIASTSLLFLDAYESPPKPTRRYADTFPLAAQIQLQASLRDADPMDG